MKYENTLFYGNGLNYNAKGSISWVDLLSNLAQEYELENKIDPVNSVYTMYYEQIVMKNKKHVDIYNHEHELKRKIAKEMNAIEPTDIIKRISKMNIKNYITTNYDYALRTAFEKNGYKWSVDKEVNREKLYSVRRGMKVKKGKGENKDIRTIWNIHGEVNVPKSIMLGLDHYCGYISKLDSYVKGNYSRQFNGETIKFKSIKKKIKKNGEFEADNYSWVELFFNSNVHILGFGFDYSETDIWWVLNKRARLLKDDKLKESINNKIFYYDGDINKEKKSYLESFNVIVVEKDKKEPWNSFYDKIFKNLI